MEKVNGEFHKHEGSLGEDRIYKKERKIVSTFKFSFWYLECLIALNGEEENKTKQTPTSGSKKNHIRGSKLVVIVGSGSGCILHTPVPPVSERHWSGSESLSWLEEPVAKRRAAGPVRGCQGHVCHLRSAQGAALPC